MAADLLALPAAGENGTSMSSSKRPRAAATSFNFDSKAGLFKLNAVLPEGSRFPYGIGFVPGTIGEDGDFLDVLLLLAAPLLPIAFADCLVECWDRVMPGGRPSWWRRVRKPLSRLRSPLPDLGSWRSTIPYPPPAT